MHTRAFRATKAVAHSIASLLGLGDMPWVGTYLVGRDLVQRLVGRLAVDRALMAVGSGEWTSVVDVMKGTVTEPMVLPDGMVIPPTGRAFRLPMATVGHWTKDGVVDEELLFWGGATYAAQMGLGQSASAIATTAAWRNIAGPRSRPTPALKG